MATARHKGDGGPTTSDDATLSALALSGVTLDPTFVSSTETYTATVGNAVTETTVTATPTDSGATVAFKDGDDNTLTSPVSLAVGANVIKAEVTAEDTTTTKTYMVTVTREAAAGTCLAPTFTGRAEVWRGTITVGNDAFSRGYEDNRFGDLSDPDNFDYGGTNYTIAGIRESFDTGSVNRLELDLDAFLPDSDQDKLRLHLCGDTFDLTTATQAGTSTYRWTDAVLDWSGATTIEAALSGTLSTDATLSALALSGVTLDPTFVSSTETYTATVVNAVTETTVTATPTHSGATVAFKDGDDTALTNPVTLAVGANVIKAVVTAEDTTTMKTYMVTVTREAPTTTCLAPTFTGRMQIWTGTVTVGTYDLGGTPLGYGRVLGHWTTPNLVSAGRYTVDGERGCRRDDYRRTSCVQPDRRAGDGGHRGAHPACLRRRVRLADAPTTARNHTYNWAQRRPRRSSDTSRTLAERGRATTTSTDATLSALALSGVTLDPTFVSATEDYTATVGNAVTETTVTATPTHSGATVAFKDGDDTALTNPVTLAVGANVIKAVVTAEDTTTMKTYMVTVTREATTTTAPAIVTGGVQVTSTPMATGDTYGLGETIEITVTFDKAVTVDTSGGTPRIQFRLDGNKNRWAEYSSGSGGTALVFTYTVQAGDMDADGIWLAANLLQLRSGTIRDATDNTVAATLTYDEPGLQTEHKVDGSRTTTVDATLRILRLSGVTLDPTFVSTTETYTATVVNSVTETTVTATPTHSGATVAFKDGADIALTNPVTLAEGANVIKAVVTSEDTTTMKTYMVTVTRGTTTAPEIVADGVQVTSTPMATGDTYGLGETIEITVTFDNAVTVDTSGGTPRIAFRLDGDPNPNRWAEYSSGSGGTALVFTYTVLADDMDDDGIRLPANTIQLFGGTIRDATDNAIVRHPHLCRARPPDRAQGERLAHHHHRR